MFAILWCQGYLFDEEGAAYIAEQGNRLNEWRWTSQSRLVPVNNKVQQKKNQQLCPASFQHN